jgi:GntR family transcriptional regulator, transcriptional repressor for pyruvate dehydrogenase complex
MDENRLAVEKFEAIDIKDPASIIIDQIRGLLADGTLKPGVSLPSERELAERFGVGRGHIRKALAKLEFYGILKTIPKKGTIVASIGLKAIEGLLSSILQFEKPELRYLLETRTVLEVSSAGFAAQRASKEEIDELKSCLEDFRNKAEQGLPAMEEDHLIHLKIASLSKNTVLLSLISLITPDIIAMNKNFLEQDEKRFQRTIEEHEAIVAAIAAKDPDAARSAMGLHMAMSTKRRIS